MVSTQKQFFAQKLEMTQIFREDKVIPVTKVQIITQNSNQDKEEWGDLVVGQKVDVKGVSKGKGFEGVMKRHKFHGAPATHGTKHGHRSPGSIGATAPQRVFKGIKMAGRMGGKGVTIKNLEIIDINEEKNIIFLKGAIPGAYKSKIKINISGEATKNL